MSCGLVPLVGEVVTEQAVLSALFSLSVTPIACGGISGAEGATTLVLDGSADNVRQAVEWVVSIRENMDTTQENVVECYKGSAGCASHKNCAWRDAKGGKLTWREK